MPPRAIRLRRPATLSLAATPFVPPSSLQPEIERRWVELCRTNSAYFDGRLLHVLGVHRNGHGGAAIHVMECAYRHFAVQAPDFDVGVRPLGVKGVTTCGPKVLMGRRAVHLAAYPGLWEFAPSGGAEPGKSPSDLIQEELIEETGHTAETEPVPMAVLHDPVLRCWELVYALTTSPESDRPRTDEYVELEWRPFDQLPQPLSPIASQIAALLPSIVARSI